MRMLPRQMAQWITSYTRFELYSPGILNAQKIKSPETCYLSHSSHKSKGLSVFYKWGRKLGILQNVTWSSNSRWPKHLSSLLSDWHLHVVSQPTVHRNPSGRLWGLQLSSPSPSFSNVSKDEIEPLLDNSPKCKRHDIRKTEQWLGVLFATLGVHGLQNEIKALR